jgi:hypothetical protein
MSTAKTQHNARDASAGSRREQESPQEMTQEVVEYLTEYAKHNPGYAALWCLGIGFVLGWKLKPW